MLHSFQKITNIQLKVKDSLSIQTAPLPGNKKLFIHRVQGKTSQFSFVQTRDVIACMAVDCSRWSTSTHQWNQFFMFFLLWYIEKVWWAEIANDWNHEGNYWKSTMQNQLKIWFQERKHTRNEIHQVRMLPNFRFVPLSRTSTISESDEFLWDFSPFTFTIPIEWAAGLAWVLEPDGSFAPDHVDFIGSEILGFTAGIKSSVLDWDLFLEEPSLIRTGLIDLRSTFTLLVPLAGELLDETTLSWHLRRANLDCESSNLFSASSSCKPLTKNIISN